MLSCWRKDTKKNTLYSVLKIQTVKGRLQAPLPSQEKKVYNMPGVIKSKLEGLSPEVRAELDGIVETVMSNEAITIVDEKGNARVKTDHLSALIELLTAEKKAAQSVDEAHAVEDKAVAKAEAEAQGAVIAKTIEVGDTVSFTMGSGKAKTTFTRKVIKVTDKTFHVEFDEAYPCTTSLTAPVGKKFVKFSAIVAGSIVKAVKVAEVAA